MAKPPTEPVPPRGSVPPAKPIATVSGAAPRKPAAQTLVGYDAPNPDTLVGYEAPSSEDTSPERPSAAPKPAPHVRSAGAPLPSRASAAPPKPVVRPSAAPPKPVVRASAAPPRASAAPPPPRASAAPPPPPVTPAQPLHNEEAAELDAMLGQTRTLDSASVEMLTSQELVLDEPKRPERTDNTEELTSLEVDRLSVGTPPPVPTTSIPPSLDDLPKAKRSWVWLAAPVVILLVGGLAYTAWSADEVEENAEEAAAVAPASTMTEAPAAPPATAISATPSTTSMTTPSTAMTDTPATAMTDTPSTTAMTDTPSTTAMTDTPPSTTMAVAVAPSTATTAAPTMAETSMAGEAAPAPSMTESASAMRAAPAAPAAPIPGPRPFAAARLDELAPMPEVTARIERMRDSARENRAERALRSASRQLRSDDFDDAKESFSSALAYKPDSVEAMVGLATIAIEQEQWDVALAWTQRALTVDARHVQSLLLRGDAVAGKGDRDAARAVWREVLEIDPRNRDARSRLRRRSGRRR